MTPVGMPSRTAMVNLANGRVSAIDKRDGADGFLINIRFVLRACFPILCWPWCPCRRRVRFRQTAWQGRDPCVRTRI